MLLQYSQYHRKSSSFSLWLEHSHNRPWELYNFFLCDKASIDWKLSLPITYIFFYVHYNYGTLYFIQIYNLLMHDNYLTFSYSTLNDRLRFRRPGQKTSWKWCECFSVHNTPVMDLCRPASNSFVSVTFLIYS